jgi:hypothetical protein
MGFVKILHVRKYGFESLMNRAFARPDMDSDICSLEEVVSIASGHSGYNGLYMIGRKQLHNILADPGTINGKSIPDRINPAGQGIIEYKIWSPGKMWFKSTRQIRALRSNTDFHTVPQFLLHTCALKFIPSEES